MKNLVCYEMAIKNIKKHKIQTLLNILISITIIFLINLYMGNLQNVQMQLKQLPEMMPVYGYITNISGGQKVGLEIDEDIVEQISGTGLIKDANYTSRLVAGEGLIEPEEWRQLKLSVIAANNIQAVTETKVSDAERCNEILQSDKKLCIVNQNAAKEKGWDIGDNIVVTLYYYELNETGEMKAHLLQTCEIQVAAIIEDISIDADWVQADIVLPIEAVHTMFREQGVPYRYDSFSFYVKKPLELNEFKSVMKELKMQSVSQQSASNSVKGTALYLKDESFISMANQLQEQIGILHAFIPVLFFMLVLLEVVISFLFVQGRKTEITIQRILGMKGREVKKLFLCEQAMVIFIAGGVCFIGLMAMGYSYGNVLLAIGCVMLSAVLGSYISLTREEIIPIMKRIPQFC